MFIQELVSGLDAIDYNLKVLSPKVTPLYNNAAYTMCPEFMLEELVIQCSLMLNFALDTINRLVTIL